MTKVFNVVIAYFQRKLGSKSNRSRLPRRRTCIIHTGLWMFSEKVGGEGRFGESRFLHQQHSFVEENCTAMQSGTLEPAPDQNSTLLMRKALFILIFRCKFYFHNLLPRANSQVGLVPLGTRPWSNVELTWFFFLEAVRLETRASWM